MSNKAHTPAAKPEASSPVGSRSAVLRRERTAWHAQDDVKDNAANAVPEFRHSAPSVPANPTAGHNFASIPVHAPAPVVPLQAKLHVSEPNDVYEQEADRTADTVLRMPEPVAHGAGEDDDKPDESTIQAKPLAGQITPLVQRQAENEEEEEEETVQTKSLIQRQAEMAEEEEEEEEEPIQAKAHRGKPASVPADLEAQIKGKHGQGQQLPDSTRTYFEPRFGHDFSQVRIHADGQAANAAGRLNSQAFTRGKNIFFGTGRYQPHTAPGRHLLAHELTHTIQQTGGRRLMPQQVLVPSGVAPVASALLTMRSAGRIPDAGRLLDNDQGKASEVEVHTGPRTFGNTPHLQKQAEGGEENKEPTNLEKLDEMLSRFDVPEEEIIDLLGRLSPVEKSKVLTGDFRGKLAIALNIEEMVRAVNNLAPALEVKLTWVKAAATVTSQIDYSNIKAMITSASQAERDVLKTAAWQDFFVAVCTNETIVEAVNDLGFDLETKLRWIRAEAVSVRLELSYADIKPMITSASQAERDVLKTAAWQDFFVAVCTNETIVEAVNDLGFDLETKLRWIQAEAVSVRLELSYADIKAVITSASQAERNVLKTSGWQDFFVAVCTDQTMAEAVDDLGFDLETKLHWMITEGTSYGLVKPRVQAASAPEKAAALANHALLRSLRDELGWNDFAKCVELLGSQAPSVASLQADATVQAALAQAWVNSNPSVPALGTTQHEEGGWIYMNLISGNISVRQAPRGAGASINLSSPPDVADSVVVGMFHTHPNLGPGWTPGPSPQDLVLDAADGVPDIVVGSPNTNPVTYQLYQSGPNRRLHLAGSRGLPGAGGGTAPQAKEDGTYDER